MAFQLKHMTGNHTQQNTRLLSARNTLLALIILSSGYTPSGYAAIDVAAGDEFIVNEETGGQSNASVAMDADGDFVVTWHSDIQAGSGFDISARLISATESIDLSVNKSKNSNQKNPDVAMDADGDFVVVWQSFIQDGDKSGIYGQRFDSAGNPVGSEFLVNTVIKSNQINPSIAMDADGDFVVVWQSDGNLEDISGYRVIGRHFSADDINNTCTDTCPEFLVSTEINSDQIKPNIAMDAEGNFVVVWQSNDNKDKDDSGYGIFGRLFPANSEPDELEFLVNSEKEFNQDNPDVAMDANGDFVVVWQSNKQDGDGTGIYGKRYDADGNPAGSEFLVNTVIDFDQENPDVTMDADGDFVVSWQSNGNVADDDSEYDIISRLYSVISENYKFTENDIVTASDEFIVNTTIASEQITPSVSMDADGDFIVAWQSGDKDDDSSYDIFGRRYTGNAETIDLKLTVRDSEDPVTTGNNFTYILTTTNNGDGIAMDVELAGEIPVKVTYVSDDSASAGWLCALDTSALTPALKCNLPFLNPGESSTINVTVTSSTAGTANTTARVSSAQADSNPDDNTDTETTASFLDASVSSGNGGGGSLGWLSGILFLFALRRKNLA